MVPNWKDKNALACVNKMLWQNCQKVLYTPKIIAFEEEHICALYFKTLAHIEIPSSFNNSALLARVAQCATRLKSIRFNRSDHGVVSVKLITECCIALVGKKVVIRAPAEDEDVWVKAQSSKRFQKQNSCIKLEYYYVSSRIKYVNITFIYLSLFTFL